MVETKTGALGEAQKIVRPLRKFTPFPKLPPELRDKIWNFAAPGPRIVTVRAGNSLIHNVTKEIEGTDKSAGVRKGRRKIAFYCNTKDLGMLRACRESRQVVVKRLPIRLPSWDLKQEIRLGPHDVLSISNIRRFLMDLKLAYIYKLEVPYSIVQIPALIIFSEIDDASNLDGFLSIVKSWNLFQPSLSILKNLRTLVFCAEDRRKRTHDDKHCFSDYTTNFDSSLLTPEQSILFAHTKAQEKAFMLRMNHEKKEKIYGDFQIPKIKIMAKGWPLKRIEPAEELEPMEEIEES